eukprot:9523665-Alexandrium_andersonii.AAC.1
MSASLVGSEMCIRDSSKRGCHPARARWDLFAGPWRECLMRCRLGGHDTDCLLYTSDAADDM